MDGRDLILLCFLIVNISLIYADTVQQGKNWVLLVSGSNGYWNYRHQADICHAYQIAHRRGIPDDNIIVMMFDDIANSTSNPTPGIVVNEPDGENVYAGVPVDYSREMVKAETFLAVLRGDKAAVQHNGTARVIESSHHDNIFVNFVDHGAPGLLAMPSDVVYASQLIETLMGMSAENKFAKLVLYVEACESGSMFDRVLPDDMNIFAVTAADPHESSYACYYDKKRETYVGDLFSVMWMNDAEDAGSVHESMHHQFEVVRSRTNASHVEEYGDLDIGSMLLDDFLGKATVSVSQKAREPKDITPSRDVPVAILQYRIADAKDEKTKRKLKLELRNMMKLRRELEIKFMEIVKEIVRTDSSSACDFVGRKQMQRIHLINANLACYESLVRQFNDKCCNIAKNTHALSQLYLFANLCDKGYSQQLMINIIERRCATPDSNFLSSTGIV